jgi:CHAT domain-containing protein/tetratricopeptide (TPR) repeat protein
MDGPQHPMEQVAAFFAALQRRALAECQDSLARLAAAGPDSADWHAYLSGIYAFEAEHDWARAEAAFRLVSALGGDPLLRSRTRLALGRSLDVQGRWDEALAAFSEARSGYAALGLRLEEAKALKQLAITANNGFTKGDYGPEALGLAARHALQALEVVAGLDRTDPDVRWLEGSIWNTLGLIRRNTGELEEATACYERDLAICVAGADRYGMGLTYGNLGEIYQLRGRASWPAAREAYLQALAIIRAFEEPYEEAEALANLGFLHRAMGRLGEALEYFDRAVERIEGLRAGVSDDQARSGYFGTVVDTYAHAVLCAVETGSYARAFGYAERARARAYLDLLAAEGVAQPTTAGPADLERVMAALPADAVLLEYFTCGLVESPEDRPHPGVQRHRFPPPRTLLFAITRETVVVWDVGLDPTALRPASLDAVVERHFLEPAIRSALYAMLVAPAEPLVKGRRQILIVPHGPLHYVPFPALIAADGETMLRPGGPEVVYGLSASTLVAAAVPNPDGSERRCLAVGYNGSGRRRLRFAEGEARSVVQKTGGLGLVGDTAKLATVIAESGRYRWLHLSCHGAFHPDRPLASGLQISASEVLTAHAITERLRLTCDLVVLSACESGLSRVRRGDELIGLVNSFLTAGAGAVICSLWQVDELSTRILFEAFYERLIDGETPPRALASAQQFLRGLTRSQARALAERFAARDLLPDLFEGAAASLTAEVKGLPALADAQPEACPYADPRFWAPFVLISGAWPGDRP